MVLRVMPNALQPSPFLNAHVSACCLFSFSSAAGAGNHTCAVPRTGLALSVLTWMQSGQTGKKKMFFLSYSGGDRRDNNNSNKNKTWVAVVCDALLKKG